jgi:hypothetical protein
MTAEGLKAGVEAVKSMEESPEEEQGGVAGGAAASPLEEEEITRDETYKRSQCRFHAVSDVLEMTPIRVVGMKRFASLSSSFHAKTLNLLIRHPI